MSRYLLGLYWLVLFAPFVGCQPTVSESRPGTPPAGTPPGAARNDDTNAGDLDYAGWTSLTKEPLRVAAQEFSLCRPASLPSERTKERHGPHFAPAIMVYANSTATQHRAAHGATTFPVGSAIVKEKYWHENDAQPTGYAAMVKREAGYDSAHGDWEYVFVNFGPPPAIERGRIESCVQCHATAASQDYVFRTYLTGEQAVHR